MRKALVTFLLILLSLMLMAPCKVKGQKLRIDKIGWDNAASSFIIELSCKFGIATAGEHADFKIRTVVDIFDMDGNQWDTVIDKHGFGKIEGAEKDADGFAQIEGQDVDWDRNGFPGGYAIISVELLGPSGNTIGDIIVSPDKVDIEPVCGSAGCPES